MTSSNGINIDIHLTIQQNYSGYGGIERSFCPHQELDPGHPANYEILYKTLQWSEFQKYTMSIDSLLQSDAERYKEEIHLLTEDP
jgi:hypothetical protein